MEDMVGVEGWRYDDSSDVWGDMERMGVGLLEVDLEVWIWFESGSSGTLSVESAAVRHPIQNPFVNHAVS